MFQEDIAKFTAEHLRTHVKTYLDDWSERFDGSERLTLPVPKVVWNTLVGGAMQTDPKDTPLITVDCLNKQNIQSRDNLYYCEYQGAFAGLVTGASSHDVDRICKRYAAVTEKFIKEHMFIGNGVAFDGFSLMELYYVNTGMSGAMELKLEEEQPLWAAGFTTRVGWVASEDQPRQHP